MPLPLAGLKLGAMALGPLISGIGGISQAAKARKLEKQLEDLKRPEYNIPEEIAQQQAMRQNLLFSQGPIDQYREQLGESMAGTMYNQRQAAPSSAAMLGAASMSQATQDRGLRDIAGMQEQRFQTNLAGKEAADKAMAEQRITKQQFDEIQPFYEEVAAKSGDIRDLKTQSRDYFGQAISGIGDIAMAGALGSFKDLNLFNKNKMFKSPILGFSGMPSGGGFPLFNPLSMMRGLNQ